MGNPVPTAAARVAKGNGPSFKRRVRMLRAARLEAALYKDPEIAAFLNLSLAGLAQMKADPEYAAIRMQVLTGVVSDAEKELIRDTEYKHELLRDLVPAALRNLFDLANSQNESIKLKATAEILDREGTMAKVSRIGLATADQGGIGNSIDDETAANLVTALNNLKNQRVQEEEDGISSTKGQTAGSTTIQ